MRLSRIRFPLCALVAGLAACGLAPDPEGYPKDLSPEAEAAPWPRLADAPAPAQARAQAPDPMTGRAIVADLSGEARDSAARAGQLAEPVFQVETLKAEAAELRRARP